MMNNVDILELQSTIMIIKVYIKREFDQTEERIGDIEDRPIEILCSEEHWGNGMERNKRNCKDPGDYQ